MKSVRTAIRVFEAVAARQPIGLSELSRQLDVPKPSVQRALSTLYAAGWLRRDVLEPGRWYVSARFAILVDTAPGVAAASEAARPHLRALRQETTLSAGLFVLDGTHMAYVGSGGGLEEVRAVELAHGPLPIHVSAAGRAILSRLPVPTRREVLDRSLRRYTESTLTTRDQVLSAIAKAEREGYAIVMGEYRTDMSAVAAPVVNRFGMPVAAVAAFATDGPMSRRAATELGERVMANALAIGNELSMVTSPVVAGLG